MIDLLIENEKDGTLLVLIPEGEFLAGGTGSDEGGGPFPVRLPAFHTTVWDSMKVRLHAFERASLANGPGLRAVAWFQGCSLACPGCFNPSSHDSNDGASMNTEELAGLILAGAASIEGVSISGGEPFEQPEALLDLLARLQGSGLGVLIFSGYTLPALRRMPLGPAILARTDVLIAGPYVRAQHVGRGLLGSANQRIQLLTSRYRSSQFGGIPAGEAIIHREGSITLTGIQPLRQ
jgi:anaerobic ribonucleoside-triphosphate reductase activating protein